ncbi:E3 ubiquitin-protein ligase RNF135 isoform X2 [Xenopus laevis]|uniref:E3 ubiquitin-protein ligase RNF135 isoform X2 n=1 Tax=Xenopus laevis TaxID=8355 RepID=A0A8J0TUD8_XENLA|nr:E3 ubiquitin-protein ligase RNF135 isoform X2 [Xenopus laevis]
MEEQEECRVLRLQPKDLSCIICFSHYNCPCTLPCGHTFCRQCILKCWDPGSRYNCPICQVTFASKPQLNKNTVLASLLDSLHSQTPTSHQNCPSCTGTGALQLCLPCSAPLCSEHLPLHLHDPTRRRHLLVTLPTATWPCRDHPQAFQFYCVSHCAPVCPDCKLQYHSQCEALPTLLERYRRMEETTEKMIRDFSRDIASMEELASSRQNAYRETQILSCDIKDNLTRDFQEMRDYLERQERAAFWRIRQEQDAAHRKMLDSVAHITEEIQKLREKKVHLEEKLHSDWLELLKSDNVQGNMSKSVTHHPCSLREPQCLFDENRIVDTTQVISEMKLSLLAHQLLEQAPCPPKKEEPFGVPSEAPAEVQPPMPSPPAIAPRKLLQWAHEVSFDPQTVSSRLSLSSDNKTVTVMETNKQYPNGPKRFRNSQVLCAQSFSSECCYWEICAREGTSWGIGVACAEIETSERLGRNHLSWCVEQTKEGLSAWHKSQRIRLSVDKPELVGVFLDCGEKLLSFYSIIGNSEVLLHSYRLDFSSCLFPAVWLYGLIPGTSLSIRDLKSQESDC